MMQKLKSLTYVAIGAALLAGCGDNASSGNDGKKAVVTIQQDSRPYVALATNDVLVRVNGAELTKAELERQIEFRLAMAKLRPMRKPAEKDLARMRATMLKTGDRQFISQELLKSYAVSNGLSIVASDRAKMREQLVRNYVPGGSYSKLMKRLSDEQRAILSEDVDRQIWVRKGRDQLIAAKSKPVSDQDVATRRENMKKYNQRAKAAQDWAWQEASNVWKKATGGYPFEKLVEKYADGQVEHVSADADWGDLKASDYKNEKQFLDVLMSLPEGAIPPPVEGDNGLLVVKILKIKPADPANGQSEALFRLAKVFFELPELFEEETDEQIRADIVSINEREALNAGMLELVKASKIEYPCGTNLFPRASAKRAAKRIPSEARRRLPRGVNLPQ